MEIKHSVVIIAYNVEKYIAEAIDSCLNQSVKPYEIIIGENCSTDNTKKIIQEYEKKYPDIIKVTYHKENLGEYGNKNNLKQNIILNGDMIHLLDGDDVFKDGMFEEMNKIIRKNNLDPQKEKYIIVSNVANLYLDGSEKIMLNNYQKKDFNNYVRLKIRGGFGSRNSGISKALYLEMPLWNEHLGPWADYNQVVGLYQKVEKLYFINKTFPIYRIGSGITSNEDTNIDVSYNINETDQNLDKKQQLQVSYLNVLYNINKTIIDKKTFLDVIYLKKEIYKITYKLYKKNLFLFLFYKFLDFPVAIKYEGIYNYLREFIDFFSKATQHKLKKIWFLLKILTREK